MTAMTEKEYILNRFMDIIFSASCENVTYCLRRHKHSIISCFSNNKVSHIKKGHNNSGLFVVDCKMNYLDFILVMPKNSSSGNFIVGFQKQTIFMHLAQMF